MNYYSLHYPKKGRVHAMRRSSGPHKQVILISETARRLSNPAQDATKNLQAKIVVVFNGHQEKLDEKVQELPSEVG